MTDADSPFPDPHRSKLASVDGVPDRLLIEAKEVGDFLDGQKLIWHALRLTEPPAGHQPGLITIVQLLPSVLISTSWYVPGSTYVWPLV